MPGTKTLATKEATTGSANIGTFTVGPGFLWIISDCAGGLMTVYVDPGTKLPIICVTNGVTPSGNRVEYSATREVTIRVEADGGVRWNLRVSSERG
jgi:hypothetical protein